MFASPLLFPLISSLWSLVRPSCHRCRRWGPRGERLVTLLHEPHSFSVVFRSGVSTDHLLLSNGEELFLQIYLFTAIKIEQRIAGVLKPSSRTMFTPPPSPPERLSMDEKSFSNSESVLEVEGNEAEMSARSMVSLDLQKKKGIGRRVRWIVVLVPIVLILVAFSTHLASSSSPFLMHNAPGNLETWQPEHDNIFSSSFHKRTPSPQSQPQALTISNTVRPADCQRTHRAPSQIPQLPLPQSLKHLKQFLLRRPHPHPRCCLLRFLSPSTPLEPRPTFQRPRVRHSSRI